MFLSPRRLIGEGQTNGIYNGTIRPLRATRGNLVDVSLENQFGPRLVTRTNLYYKKLNEFRRFRCYPKHALIQSFATFGAGILWHRDAAGAETGTRWLWLQRFRFEYDSGSYSCGAAVA